ncbi:MAG: PEGA domain-containing protein [Opitutales bacterium]|nr:PEGA domain-containing protein [Opitutales bacterium]
MTQRFLKICFFLFAGFVCALFCGCRSYNDSVWKTVDFNSVPGDATVFINGKNCGLTPRTERLSKRGSYDVRFSKPGYFDENFVLESFEDDNGLPDILDSIDVALIKITPETLALRERLERERAEAATVVATGTPEADSTAPEVAATEENSGMSPAAREFAARAKPTDFTDFRLQEKALKRLFQRREITEAEYNSLHEALYNSYNETRLLKAPRLGTYEKAF